LAWRGPGIVFRRRLNTPLLEYDPRSTCAEAFPMFHDLWDAQLLEGRSL